MKILALMLFVIMILVVCVLMRSKTSKVSNRSAKTNKTLISKNASVEVRHPYSATSIVSNASACQAGKAVGKRRFLDVDRDIPVLPVNGCNVSHCSCRYAHHDDRRESSEDRRHPPGLKTQLYDSSDQQNKRETSRGRRKSD